MSKAEKVNRVGPRTCVVCGDPATGYQYQTAACNGCKNFLSRAILAMKIFRPCSSEGSCTRTGNKSAIKSCRACRFSRCVEGGMNPLCIISEVPPDQNALMQAVLERRGRLMCSSGPSSSNSSPALAVDLSPKTHEILISRLLAELTILELAHEKIRRSHFSPSPKDAIPLADLIRGKSKLANDYGTFDMLFNCAIPDDSRSSFCCLDKFLKVWPHADLVYAIEYLKSFDVFYRLDQQEQLVLSRWVISVCAHLTASFFSYTQKSKGTCYPDGSAFNIVCAADTPQKRQFHYESIERIRNLDLHQNEYVLLKAIIVCDPTIEGLTDYGRAPVRFLEMLRLLDWLRTVNERRKEQHLLRTMVDSTSRCCSKGANDTLLLQDEIFL